MHLVEAVFAELASTLRAKNEDTDTRKKGKICQASQTNARADTPQNVRKKRLPLKNESTVYSNHHNACLQQPTPAENE